MILLSYNLTPDHLLPTPNQRLKQTLFKESKTFVVFIIHLVPIHTLIFNWKYSPPPSTEAVTGDVL